MSPPSAYRFCTPDQQTVAVRAKIVAFLTGDGALLGQLNQLALQLEAQFIVFWGAPDRAKLSGVLSYVLGTSPSDELKNKFIDHILKNHVTDPTHACLDAMGPVVVALL